MKAQSMVGTKSAVSLKKFIPKVIAYMRSATYGDGLERQKEEIIGYAESKGLTIDEFIEVEGISSNASIQSRRVSELIDKLVPGDMLIVTDFARLSRKPAECIVILAELNRKQIELKMVAIS